QAVPARSRTAVPTFPFAVPLAQRYGAMRPHAGRLIRLATQLQKAASNVSSGPHSRLVANRTRRHSHFVPGPDVSNCSKTKRLFDHLVGDLLNMQRHLKSQCLGSLEVDYQLELRWLHNR